MGRLKPIAWIWTLAWTTMTSAVAQGDTLGLATPVDSVQLRVQRVTLASALLPGSGQIANGQWWKAPLIWGGLGYAGWSFSNNHKEYRRSVEGLIAIGNNEPLPDGLTDLNGNPLTESQLEERALFYRRNRDLSALSWLIVHALQVLDANTGAMLRSFDTSESLQAQLGWMHGTPTMALVWRPRAKQPPRHD